MIVIKQLTKDADKLLCIFYKDYLSKVKSGLSKSSSSCFGNSDEITAKYLPDWHPEDTADICWELHKAGYAVCSRGDDIANDVTLTREAIVYMENRFKNGINDVTDFISKFFPLIPPLK